jgi:hypothetical protein
MKIAYMNTLKNFVKSVFSVNLMTNAHHDFDNFNDRAILAMHNDTVKKLNDLILQSRVAVGLGFEQKFPPNPWVWVRSGWVFKWDFSNPWAPNPWVRQDCPTLA